MARMLTVLALVIAFTGTFGGSAEAKEKPKPGGSTYYLNWLGDCGGSGYLALKAAPNSASCALFLPGVRDTHSFPGSEGLPMALDTAKEITVDFNLSSVVSVATELNAVVTGTVGGKHRQIASGTQTLLFAGGETTPVHFNLDPNAALDKKTVTDLTVTINVTSGVTYSKMWLEDGATMVIHGQRMTVARRSGTNAVVAIIDTGINPYHVTFRDNSARAYRHPSTYIEGYPKSARALRLTFDAPTITAALLADCERVWKKIETGKLYWFPGTKIIGAISFANKAGDPCALSGDGSIIDADGHGTMTASRATSVEYGACKECRVVAIQFSARASETKDALESITWAADNADWIDAQSNSWGPFVPGWEPTGSTLFTSGPQLVRAIEETAQKHLSFWGSGNGVLFRGGAVGHPTTLDPHFTPSAIMVGGVDSGYVNTWPGFPAHVVSDSCNSWAAENDSLDKSGDKVGSGTSSATPFAAGGAIYELLKAREILGDTSTGVEDGVVARGPKRLVKSGPLADGEFTLKEWKRLVFVSATERPEAQYEDGPPCDVVDGAVAYSTTPVKWTDLPEEYPEYLHIGYGAVDRPAMKLATKILLGKSDLPDRSDTDEFFKYDRQVRETTYPIWSRP